MTLFSFDLRIGGSEIEEEEDVVDSESDELTYFLFLCFLAGFGESIFGGGSGFLSVIISLFDNFCSPLVQSPMKLVPCSRGASCLNPQVSSLLKDEYTHQKQQSMDWPFQDRTVHADLQ